MNLRRTLYAYIATYGPIDINDICRDLFPEEWCYECGRWRGKSPNRDRSAQVLRGLLEDGYIKYNTDWDAVVTDKECNFYSIYSVERQQREEGEIEG